MGQAPQFSIIWIEENEELLHGAQLAEVGDWVVCTLSLLQNTPLNVIWDIFKLHLSTVAGQSGAWLMPISTKVVVINITEMPSHTIFKRGL